jgi:CDP-glucose 4,6-dehydratase
MYFQNKFKNKRVVVIGHTGFKGSWLTLWLTKLGAQVYGFSKDIPTSPSHFELANIEKHITDHRGNIIDYNELLMFLKKAEPEIIFHLGANAIVSDCVENPQDAFLTNAMGTVNVLEAIRHLPSLKAAVIVTSDKCYENVEWEFGYRETDRLGGKDPYSASKACAELAFSSYYRTYLHQLPKLKISSARAGNVIGGGDWAKNRIVPDCIRSWTKNQNVQIRNPKSTRPWQHVLEPLSGYLTLAAGLLDQDCTYNGEAFNFGPRAEVNKAVDELINEMKKHWNNVSYQYDENHSLKQKEASLLKLCCDKSLAQLSWSPTLSFDETVEMTASWYNFWNENPKDIHDFSIKQIAHYEELASNRKLAWTKS